MSAIEWATHNSRVHSMRSLLVFLLVAPASAQAPAWTVHGDTAGDGFGFALSAAGDWDSDGVVDLLVGAPGVDAVGPDSGRVTLLSGETSAVLFQVDGQATGDRAGRAVAALGDVNSDGVGDFAYGAPTRSFNGPLTGGAFVVSGADGSILHSWEGSTPFGVFGFSVASAGDLDGDGLQDLLVGAPNEDPAGPDSGCCGFSWPQPRPRGCTTVDSPIQFPITVLIIISVGMI